MTIIYLGSLSTTDSDFPLIRSLQNKGINLICYFPLFGKVSKAGLISIRNIKKKDAIVRAREYDAFKQYENYVNLDNIYVINNYHNKRYNWQSFIIWLKFIQHAKRYRPSVFHFVWPFTSKRRSILYLWRIKKVLTVHDPLVHSSQRNDYLEKVRTHAFMKVDRLVLLSSIHMDAFCLQYKVPEKKITLSRFGFYDWLKYANKIESNISKPFILFWGQIQSHKGVDILLEAMKQVHQIIPDLVCVIAGKGSFSFDVNPYKSLDYIEFRNYFIEIPELKGLLDKCLFAVAPYKDATQSGVVQTAFSAGVPLIVTNVGSLPESVQDGMMGIVVPPNDTNALANSIIKLASNKEMRQTFKHNIENVWKKEMSWDNIAEIYIKMYQELTE